MFLSTLGEALSVQGGRSLKRGSEQMRGISVAAASAAVVVLGGVGGAVAADLNVMPTKAPVLNAAGNVCTSLVDFFTTACQVSAYGIRFYGTIDVGYGYQTHGSPFNKDYSWGVNYLLSKANRSGMWLLSPNALSASNVGFQIKEPLGGGWSFVGQVQMNFDPYSLHLLDAPQSLRDNVGTPTGLQTASGDASNNGQFYNGLGFAGFSHDTWGTLTFGRQNSFGGDIVSAYDPQGGAGGFSVIGYSGAMAGGGDTEDKTGTTSAKYKVNFGNYRFGAFYQFGGYDDGNASRGQFQGDIGADFHLGPGLLSVDVEAGYTKGAVSVALAGGKTPSTFDVTPSTWSVTISDNTNAVIAAKYTLDRLTLFAGYEWIQFANPTDPAPLTINTISGFGITNGVSGAVVANQADLRNKIQQMYWAGAKYALTDSLTLSGAYYGYTQNQAVADSTCTVATNNKDCAGHLNAASVLLDWKFAPKWDTYIGTFYSSTSGGLNSGYVSTNNLATTAGLRFRW